MGWLFISVSLCSSVFSVVRPLIRESVCPPRFVHCLHLSSQDRVHRPRLPDHLPFLRIFDGLALYLCSSVSSLVRPLIREHVCLPRFVHYLHLSSQARVHC